MRMPSGVGRRGRLGIKDRKTVYCIYALPKHKRLVDEEMHARLHRRAAPPTLHVRACKAGGELTLRACQVALGGGAALASAIEKHYIVYARC